jgi:predicted SAM-dependent methyltransferase
VGQGIDIGAGNDSLGVYGEFFPMMTACRGWDIEDGDAQYMQSISDNSLDFVHSSHCLEHMIDPITALNNWIRILKPGGHLVCLVPDEDLYEQGVFPSTFNTDHKHSFTIFKKHSWSHQSINLINLISNLSEEVEVLKVELLNATYRYKIENLTDNTRYDQTLTPIGECAIEFILRKIDCSSAYTDCTSGQEILLQGPSLSYLPRRFKPIPQQL